MCDLRNLEKPRTEVAVLRKLAGSYRDLELPLPDRIIPMLERAVAVRKSITDRPRGLDDDELELVSILASVRALITYSLSHSDVPYMVGCRAVDVLHVIEQIMISCGMLRPCISEIEDKVRTAEEAAWLLEHPDELKRVVEDGIKAASETPDKMH
jgi:hypothetical protein